MTLSDIETVEAIHGMHSGQPCISGMYINGLEYTKEEVEALTTISWQVIQRRISRSKMTPYNALTRPYRKTTKTSRHWEHPPEELERNRVACMNWR